MIMAKPKPIDEIIGYINKFEKIMVAGCNGCVAVCEAGGMKEAEVLASALRIYFTQQGRQVKIDELSLTRQCDKEYLEELKEKIYDYDAVVTLACGAGVQFMAEMYNDKIILPGVDTTFIGVTEDQGYWTERCQACGQCVLATTGGICPIVRCSKRMLNGPCGGSDSGKCELSVVVGHEIPCGWHLIFERLKKLGEIQRFAEPAEGKDWIHSRDGGPREMVREDVRP